MATNARFAEVASLAGDPARAAMLHALMDGRALTATELAHAASVTPQTASGHLARMSTAGLLGLEKQGRHHYYRLASAAVAQMIESIMQVASTSDAAARAVVVGPRDAALRAARTCYDHLAGRLGTALMDALTERGLVADEHVTDVGLERLGELGIDIDAIPGRRPRFRSCLDWSERRPHAAGKLGAALAAHAFELGWVKRLDGSRALRVTAAGEAGFADTFGLVYRSA